MHSKFKSLNRGWSLSAIVLFSAIASAEWSNDPDANLAIVDADNAQVQPKIAATSDGGCYISWFDNRTGGYDVYIQKLDEAGNELWAHNGVLVADRSFSSTQDYGLDIDSSGDALLTFRDDRFGSVRITAAKVTAAGTLAWGTNGVQLTDGATYVASPKITGVAGGEMVVGWTSDDDIVFQKLDSSGAPQWGAGVALSDTGTGSFSLADLHSSDAGNVIASWVRLGPNYWDPKHLWAQKLSPAGSLLWDANHVRVFDGGSLQFGNFPPFVTDGGGGAVFSWYDTAGAVLQVYAQHILADGSEAFGHNGEVVSTSMVNRVSPDAAYNAGTQETFVFWIEKNAAQSEHGVYGQKFDATGTRMWSNTGKVLVPVSSTERSFVRALQMNGGAMVSFFESPSFGDDHVRTTRVDTNGDFVWTPNIIDTSSVMSEKGRLTAKKNSNGMAILAWHDARSDANDVYAQNVNEDGSLGVVACPADLTGDDVVNIDDIFAVLGLWGDCPDPCPPYCLGDLTEDCTVNIDDIFAILGMWGPC